MLSDFFLGKKLNKTSRLDEEVAKGAIILAKMIQNGESILPFQDIVPLSFGVKVVEDRMGQEVEEIDVLIPQNTPLPFRSDETFFTPNNA